MVNKPITPLVVVNYNQPQFTQISAIKKGLFSFKNLLTIAFSHAPPCRDFLGESICHPGPTLPHWRRSSNAHKLRCSGLCGKAAARLGDMEFLTPSRCLPLKKLTCGGLFVYLPIRKQFLSLRFYKLWD